MTRVGIIGHLTGADLDLVLVVTARPDVDHEPALGCAQVVLDLRGATNGAGNLVRS